jgi:hypothetical protein
MFQSSKIKFASSNMHSPITEIRKNSSLAPSCLFRSLNRKNVIVQVYIIIIIIIKNMKY